MNESLDFLTIKEMAVLIRVHPNTIRRAIRSGKISALRVGKGVSAIYRIPKSEINRLAFSRLTEIINKIVDDRMK